jgi:DNA modification methylase
LSEKKDKEYHEWQFTLPEAEYFIEKFSFPGDLVLDPFVGTGTFAIACMRKKRKFLGFEVDEEKYNIILERINKEVKGEVNKNGE